MDMEKVIEKNKKVQKRTIESREKLLSAAFELFAEKGYYYTNTKEIVKLAGISIGNFYNYFKDKGDIYLTLAEQYLDGSYDNLVNLINTLEGVSKDEAHNILLDFLHKQLSRACGVDRFFDDAGVIGRENEQLFILIEKCESKINILFEQFLQNHKKNIDQVSYPVMARMLYVTANEVSNDIMKVKDVARREEYILALAHFIINYCYE